MKRLIFYVMVLTGSAMVAQASCNYFRTSYKLSACGSLSTEKSDFFEGVSSPMVTLPGLEDPVVGAMDQVSCECGYVLQGSDPRCDTERTQDFSQHYPQDPSSPTCPRGKSLCATICPQHLY